MRFQEDDHVVFRGDFEKVVYRLAHLNHDGTWDLYRVDGALDVSSPEYVPERLLEAAPRGVRKGDVYEGLHSGYLYFVVGDADESGRFPVFDSSPLFAEVVRRYDGPDLQETQHYKLVSEFGLKSG